MWGTLESLWSDISGTIHFGGGDVSGQVTVGQPRTPWGLLLVVAAVAFILGRQ